MSKFTRLHCASMLGDLDEVKGLISSGVDIQARDQNGCTPLHYAAKSGKLDIIKELVRCGADLEAARNDYRYTPLHYAASQGNLDIVKELVRSGANLEARSKTGRTPLQFALICGKLNTVKELIRSSADIRNLDMFGSILLNYAIDSGNIDIVNEVGRAGADIEARNLEGHTPLHHAARSGELDTIKELVASGSDVRARSNYGNTPLHFAAYRGKLDIAKLLVWSGADLGAMSGDAVTPLMSAVINSHRTIAEFLVKEMTTAELSVVDERERNVLHWIAVWGRPWPHLVHDITDVCPDLLTQIDTSGERPIDLARNRDHDVYDILEDAERRQQQRQYTEGIFDNVDNPSNITITVVGHYGVGKSCLVRQLKQETIPEGGPGSTDTADFYINYIGYNPNTGFRQNLDKDGEIETGRQRLKRIIERYRKEDKSAVRPSDDRPTSYHDKEEYSDTPDKYDIEEEGLANTSDLRTVTLPTAEVPLLSGKKKTGIKQNLKRFFTLPFRGKRRENQRKAIPQEDIYGSVPSPKQELPQNQSIEESTYSESNDPKEIPIEQKNVIEAVMHTTIDGDSKEEVKGYVTIYDFGGEKVFYNTHHCFMSSNMVFILVFDVAMCLDPQREKDGYAIIEFWLRSIATYAIDRAAYGKGSPPIILVGSHMDQLSSSEGEQQQLFASVLEKLYEKPELRAIMETHVQEMYPIADLNDSAKNQATYQQMWEKIIEIAPLQSEWMKPVPARWVALEHELVRLKSEDRVIMTYTELLEVNKQLTVPLVEDGLIEFLWKLKFFGSFLCFDLYSKRPFIVLQAQWIINAFKAIITDPKFLTGLTIRQQLEWTAYEQSGILPVQFIRKLWGRNQDYRLLEKEENLCIALESLGLLSKPFSVDTDVNYFIVPSILQNADPEIIRPMLDDPDTVTTVAICLKFDNPFIPQAVWDKMIAACIHRFQRLDEPGVDGSKFIQRGFVCLSVDCLWNMVINCCNNCMKMIMFKKDTDHAVPAGTGTNLLSILEFLLRRILELNHQSHLCYQFYLHNDYRFTIKEKMVKVDDLRQTPRLQCYGLNGYRWIDRDEIYIWFKNPNQKTILPRSSNVDLETLPDRKLSFKEIGRVSRHIGSTYQTFFAELDCPIALVEQEMEEHRHLSFRSRIAKIFIHLIKTKPGTELLAIADAMSRHGMDPTLLVSILDSNRNIILKDDTLSDEWLQTNLSEEDASIIADHVDIKSYFNLFLELGFTPNSIDEFDDHYRNKGTRQKIIALLEAFITETDPRPTVKTILLATQECDMDTESLTEALNPPSWVFKTRL